MYNDLESMKQDAIKKLKELGDKRSINYVVSKLKYKRFKTNVILGTSIVASIGTGILGYNVGKATNKDNNINIYGEDGQLLWNISELLRTYSDKNGLKYYEDMYFDIILLGNEKISCIGFINHCEIDLKNESIINIVNNR